MKAHKQLEDLTFERDLAHFKPVIENKLSEMIYNALWFSPLMGALQSFLQTTQEVVNGVIKVELFKGNVITLGRKSENSLYDKNLATYTASDSFDQIAAKGFIKLWGLPTQVYSQVKMKNQQSAFVNAVTQNSKSKVKVAVKSEKKAESEKTGAK